MFKTTSGTTPGKFWYQTIRFHDLQAAIDLFGDDKDVTDHDIADLITHGDISVHCNCPSWKYWGWQYVGTKHGFAIQPETRKPVKNNPGQKGAVCKHIYTAIKSQPFYTNSMVADLRKMKFKQGVKPVAPKKVTRKGDPLKPNIDFNK